MSKTILPTSCDDRSSQGKETTLNLVERPLASLVASWCKKAMAEDMGTRCAKEVALALKVDPGLFSRYRADHDPATLPARIIPDWTREVGPALLQYLAEASGYALVPAAEGYALCPREALRPSLASGVARVAAEAGAAISTCLEALADGVIDARERAEIHLMTGRLLLEVQAIHRATAEVGE